MTTGNSGTERPLSPHLQVYRWGWTMSLSILHRMTGVFLSLGLLLIVSWLWALAQGPETYAALRDATGHWFVILVLAGWSFTFFYHLCNGIRHLLWDTGWGFELRTARRTGLLMVAASVTLTVLSWLLAAGVFGGGS